MFQRIHQRPRTINGLSTLIGRHIVQKQYEILITFVTIAVLIDFFSPPGVDELILTQVLITLNNATSSQEMTMYPPASSKVMFLNFGPIDILNQIIFLL